MYRGMFTGVVVGCVIVIGGCTGKMPFFSSNTVAVVRVPVEDDEAVIQVKSSSNQHSRTGVQLLRVRHRGSGLGWHAASHREG